MYHLIWKGSKDGTWQRSLLHFFSLIISLEAIFYLLMFSWSLPLELGCDLQWFLHQWSSFLVSYHLLSIFYWIIFFLCVVLCLVWLLPSWLNRLIPWTAVEPEEASESFTWTHQSVNPMKRARDWFARGRYKDEWYAWFLISALKRQWSLTYSFALISCARVIWWAVGPKLWHG